MAGRPQIAIQIKRYEHQYQSSRLHLPDENGNPVSLEQFRGKNVVLFFYPRADTPG